MPLELRPAPLLVAAANTGVPSRLDGELIEHVHYLEAYEQLWEFLTSSGRWFIGLLVGISGVGKTELMDRVIAAIHAIFRDQMLLDPGFRPIVVLAAPPVLNGRIDWAAFFELLFFKAGGVLYNRRIRSKPSVDHAHPLRRLGQQKAVEVFQDAVEQVLMVHAQVVFVEEARGFAAAARSSHPGDHADVLKAFAQATGCRVVLVGTYGLLALDSISSELSRRTRTIHFRRYRPEVAAEKDDFVTIAAKLLALFPDEDVSAEANWENQLLEGTLGGVGTLIDWLRAAEDLLGQRGAGGSLLECLRDSVWSKSGRAQAREELAAAAWFIDEQPSPLERALGQGQPPSVPAASSRRRRPTTASGQVLNPGEIGPRHEYLDPPTVRA